MPDVPAKKWLPVPLDDFRMALEEEITAIEKNGTDSILVTNGREAHEQIGTAHCYEFDIDYMPVTPPDTPCTLKIGGASFEATVVKVEESKIILSLMQPIDVSLSRGHLNTGSIALMKKLIKRIEESSDKNNYFGDRLLSRPREGQINRTDSLAPGTPAFSDEFNSEQQAAAISSLTNDITYIWGPPGTGKTHVISKIIQEAFNRNGNGAGDSILLVSHTNTAVDNALEKVLKNDEFKEINNAVSVFPILRLGTDDNLKSKFPEVSLDDHIDKSARSIQMEIDENTDSIKEYDTEIRSLQKKLQEYNWAKACELDLLDSFDLVIQELDSEIAKANSEKQSVGKELHSFSIAYPEIEKTIEKQKDLEKLNIKTDELSSRKATLESDYQKAIVAYSDAKKQVNVFEEYRSITDELLKYPTLPSLTSKLAAKRKKQDSKKERLDILTEEYPRFESEYNSLFRKNGQPKLFASKKRISELDTILKRNRNEKDDLKRNIESLETEIESLANDKARVKELTKQSKELVLTHDYNYWTERREAAEKRLTQINSKLDKTIGELNDVSEKATQLIKEVKPLEEHIAHYTKLNSTVASLDASIKELNKNMQTTIDNKTRTTEKIIEQYNSFFNEKATTLTSAIVKKINELKNSVSEDEVDSINAEIASKKEMIQSCAGKIQELERKKESLKAQVILDTRIIGTTLTKAYIDDTLQTRKFDTIIIDEVSMASIPALWCVALLATKHLVLVGDFLQLPPIVISSGDHAKEWLGTDVFIKTGASECFKKNTEPVSNCVALTQQYRMEKEIADLANRYYKEYCKLVSNVSTKERNEERKKFEDWYPNDDNDPVQIIDTSDLNAWVTAVPRGKKGSSRLNFFSASFVVAYAFKLLEHYVARPEIICSSENDTKPDPKILIVSPYKPHTERIDQLIKLEYKNRGIPSESNLIQAGTIHSFQGKEADIVLFDFVVDEPHWRANLFIGKADTETDEAIRNDQNKLFNVAITRAKFRLFFVGDIVFLRRHSKDNALGSLLKELIDVLKIKPLPAKELIPDLIYVPEGYYVNDTINAARLICDHSMFFKFLSSDIANAKKYVIIFSPFMTTTRLGDLLPILTDTCNRGIKVVVITKALEKSMSKSDRMLRLKCEDALTKAGVAVFHKKGMHEKHIFIDDHISWVGSLNPLSYSNKTTETMDRTDDEKQFEQYHQLLKLDQYLDFVDDASKKSCPICGGELVAHDGKNGVYWKCVNGDFSRNSDQPFPHDGILCCQQCGGAFKFATKNEPRWICTENNHYQKIRPGDLRLPKMKALIPQDKLPKVEQYFNTSKKDMVEKQEKTSGLLSQSELDQLRKETASFEPEVLEGINQQQHEKQISLFDKDDTNGHDSSNVTGASEWTSGEEQISFADVNSSEEDLSSADLFEVFSDPKYRHFIAFCIEEGFQTISDVDLLSQDELLEIPGIDIQTANDVLDIIESYCS